MAWKVVDYNPFDWFAKKPADEQPEQAPGVPPDLTDMGEAYEPFKALAATAESPDVALRAPVKEGGALDAQQFKEAVKGIPGGAVGFVGTTLQGAGAVPAVGQANAFKFGKQQQDIWERIDRGESVPEMDDPAGYQHMSPEQRRQMWADSGAAQGRFKPVILEQQPLYKAGQAVSDYGKTILPAAPGYEQGWGRQIGEGIGSLIAGLPFGAAGRIPGAIFFGAGGMGEAGTRAIQFDQAEKRAGRPGLSQEQINAAALYGVGPGTTDLLPVETLLGRLRVPAPGRRALAQAIGRIGGQAFVEGMQEGGQQFLQNLIAQKIYNPDQGLTQDVGGNMAVGGGVGAIAETAKELGGLAMRGITGARARGNQPGAGPSADPFLNPEILPPEPGAPAGTIDVDFEDLVPANRRLAPPELAPQTPPPSSSVTPPPVSPQAEEVLPTPPVAAAPDFTVPEATGQRGVDVLQFIRANGGLKPSRELGGMDAQRYPGLINQNGLDADKMRERMVEAGYLEESGPDEPAITTPADVYDLLGRSLSGERIIPRADLEADQAYSDKKWQREFARELKSNEQTFIFPEIDRHEPSLARGLRQAYAGLTPDERQDVILRNRRGEDIVDLLEEKTLQNPLYYAIGAPSGKRGQLEALAKRRPDLAGKISALQGMSPLERAVMLHKMPEFDRTLIERALAGESTRDYDNLGFYSKAVEAAQGLQRKSGAPVSWLNDLKKAGVTDNEIAATGLDKYLTEKSEYSKRDITDYLERNRVKLKENVYHGEDGKQGLSSERREELEEMEVESLANEYGTIEFTDDDGDTRWTWGLYGEENADAGTFDNEDDAQEDMLNELRRWVGDMTDDALLESHGRHGEDDAQLPAGRTTVEGPVQWSDYSLTKDDPSYREYVLHLDPDSGQAGLGTGQQYNSGHWSEPNVIAHIRAQLISDTKGRRVYNLDELQSDWGQALREDSGLDEDKIKRLSKEVDALRSERDDIFDRSSALEKKYPDAVGPKLGEPRGYGELDMDITNPNGDANYGGRWPVSGVMQYPIDMAGATARLTYWPKTFDWRGEEKPAEYELSSPDLQIYSQRMAGVDQAAGLDRVVEFLRERMLDQPRRFLSHAAAKALNRGNREVAKEYYDLNEKFQEVSQQERLKEAELRTAMSAAPAYAMVNDKQWIETSLRRVLQQAVDEGAEGISITPAVFQNERFSTERVTSGGVWYDLSEGKRNVQLYKPGEGTELLGGMVVNADGVVEQTGSLPSNLRGNKLSAVIGKEQADAIMNAPLGQPVKFAELTFGGKGMRHSYDKVYPETLLKIMRKLDPSIQPEKIDARGPDGRPFVTEKEKTSPQFTFLPITETLKENLEEQGQPMFAAGAQEDMLKKSIGAMIKLGRPVEVPHADATLAAVAPYQATVPNNTFIAALTRVEPVKGEKGKVRAIFKTQSGETFVGFKGPWENFSSLRAFARAGNEFADSGVFLVRFAAPGGSDPRLTGELRHESIHALRDGGFIPGETWAALLSHAKNLRVLESELKTYLQMIGDPAYRKCEAGLQVLDEYIDRYEGRPNILEKLDQEYVAHMAELYSHGALLPQEVGPVQQILDDIFAGKYAERVEEPLSYSQSSHAFAGPWARTARQGPLIRAQQMKSQGADKVDIWKETGWFQGLDGRWRFEIDDSRAALRLGTEELGMRLNRGRPLRAILDNRAVYEAYPELANVSVFTDPDMLAGEAGFRARRTPDSDPNDGFPDQFIVLGTKGLKSENRPNVLRALIHEAQHWIQDVEGFAYGTSPIQETLKAIKAREAGQLNIAQREAIDRQKDLLQAAREEANANPDDAGAQELLKNMLQKFWHRVGFDLYERSAGENEALRAMYRQSMSKDRRREVFPVDGRGERFTYQRGDNYAAYSDDLLALTTQMKDMTTTPEFKTWFGDSKVVDRDGDPLIVYHATHGDIERFRYDKVTPESDMGAGFYFTTSEDDASLNYARKEGPDIRNKIDGAVDRIKGDDEFQNEYEDYIEGKDPDDPDFPSEDDFAEMIARQELGHENEGNIIPAYLKLENPFIIGDNESFVGGPETVLKADYSDPNEGLEPDDPDYDEDAFGEPAGPLVDFVMQLQNVASRYDADVSELSDTLLQYAEDGGIEATELFKVIENSEALSYATDDDTGQLMSREIVRRALENIGFDGIMDRSVVNKFGPGNRFANGAMKGMGYDTTHYIAFKPTQIKSIFNRGTFDPNDPNISYALAGKRAIGAPKGAMDQAASMEAKGKSPEAIWKATQTYRGKDGKQRWEIDDSKAKIINLDKILAATTNKPVKRGIIDRLRGKPATQEVKTAKITKSGGIKQINVPLINLLDHPKLYAAYPFLRQMKVDLTYHPGRPEIGNGAIGRMHFKGKARIYSPIRIEAGSPESLLSVLMHELQHYVQDKEGFAKGADQGVSDPDSLPIADKNKAFVFTPQYDPARGQVVRQRMNPAGSLLINATEPERKALRLMDIQDQLAAVEAGETPRRARDRAELDDWANRAARDLEGSMVVTPSDYHNSYGEQEARAVQARLNMSPEQRARSFPGNDMPEESEVSDTRTRNVDEAYDEVMRRANVFRSILANWKQARDVGDGVKAVRTDEDRVSYMQQADQPLVELKLYGTVGGAQVGFTQEFLDLPYSEQKPIMDKVINDARKTFNANIETEELDDSDVYDQTVEFWARYDPRKVAFDLRFYRDKINQLVEEQYGPDAEIVEFLPHEGSVRVITPEAQERYDKARAKIDDTWSREHDARMKLVLEYGSMDDAREKASPEELQRYRDTKEKHTQALSSPDAHYQDSAVDLSSIFGDRTYRRAPSGVDQDMWYEMLVEEQLAANGIKLKRGEDLDFSDLIPRQ